MARTTFPDYKKKLLKYLGMLWNKQKYVLLEKFVLAFLRQLFLKNYFWNVSAKNFVTQL